MPKTINSFKGRFLYIYIKQFIRILQSEYEYTNKPLLHLKDYRERDLERGERVAQESAEQVLLKQ